MAIVQGLTKGDINFLKQNQFVKRANNYSKKTSKSTKCSFKWLSEKLTRSHVKQLRETSQTYITRINKRGVVTAYDIFWRRQ